MNFRRFKAMTLAGVMTVGMCMGTSVFAAAQVGSGTGDNPADADITKKLNIAEGVTVPNVTFTFDFTKVTTDAPDIASKMISYSSGDVSQENMVRKTVEDIFKGVTFPHAGEFKYTLKERTGDVNIDNGTMSYDSSVYTIRVYVKNKADGGLYISDITAEKDGGKKEEIDFINTFRKDTCLTVRKNTVGDMADKTKNFKFTINFTKAPTCEDNYFTSGSKIYEYGKDYTFELADGESLTFGSIPAGTRYSVTEEGAADGYTPKVTVVENGGEAKSASAGETESLSSTAVNNGDLNLAGDKTNTVTFTNTYEDVVVTGVQVDNLPFVLMILTAVGGFAGYVVLRRHKMAD